MSAKEIIRQIYTFTGKTVAEWIVLRDEVAKWCETASKEQLDEFIESNAGEMIIMITG